ncbi:hypothetical protein Syun_018432 [Stephania yunnanensis]|uniref:O-fucosyltransferase family protein n=1 Tax=Stephania yunnanensis TaxID=152371 RepID=A0AAP0ISW6_9MAGN
MSVRGPSAVDIPHSPHFRYGDAASDDRVCLALPRLCDPDPVAPAFGDSNGGRDPQPNPTSQHSFFSSSSHSSSSSSSPPKTPNFPISQNPQFPLQCPDLQKQLGSNKFLFFAPHSGFSNQLSELKNAILISAILNRTLIVPTVLDHHAVALGSCPKFRVSGPSEIRLKVWDHIVDLIETRRYVSMADVIDLSPLSSSSLDLKIIDFRVFASRFCGLGIDLTCFDVSDVGSSSLLAKLKQCGSLISSANVSVDSCLYGVDEDCRTTVWTYEQNAEDRVLDSFQPDEERRRKKKIPYFRRRRNVYKALGPGSEAELATVLAFGSLFTAPYKGSELYIDIHESPRDKRIHFLIQKFDAISFVPDILNAGKKFAIKKIKGPFRMLDGQFKNHWKTTFAGLEQKLESLKVENRLPIHIFVMTDLPEANWTGTYLGKLARDSDAYRLYNLQEEDEKVVQTARKLVPARRVTKRGFVSREIGENKLQKNCSPGTSPDILLYIEEAVCSCASLGFVGTAGSTIAESIEQMRKNGVCLNKSLVD